MVSTATAERSLSNRFVRNNDGIEVDAKLRRMFPAVFSHKASPKMSDEYQLFRSDRIIEEMDKLNMSLVEIRQQHSNKRDPAYQMHSLRFRPSGRTKALAKVGDTVAEAHIINSHNGRNKFVASSGLFRLACLNGLVVPDALYGSATMRHYGSNNTFEAVQQIVNTMMERLPALAAKMAAWRAMSLTESQQAALARLMLQIRAMPDWVKPAMVLEARREEDATKRSGSRDLWTTFNVVQENVMNRNLQNVGKGDERSSSTRPVTGALAVFNINRALWVGAERVAEAVSAGKPIPSRWDGEYPDILGAEAEKVAKMAIDKAQRSVRQGKVAGKAKKPAPAHRAQPAKAKKPTAEEAMRVRKAEAARRYRAKLKAEAAQKEEASA